MKLVTGASVGQLVDDVLLMSSGEAEKHTFQQQQGGDGIGARSCKLTKWVPPTLLPRKGRAQLAKWQIACNRLCRQEGWQATQAMTSAFTLATESSGQI